MKVVQRILGKLLFLILVISIGACAAIFWKGNEQGSADHTILEYVKLLAGGRGQEAYRMLDFTSGIALTMEEYLEALDEKNYGQYPAWRLKEDASSTGTDGRVRARYLAQFVDDSDQVVWEEAITVCSGTEKDLGLFTRWAVLPDHCLIENYKITVPAHSEVYLDGEKLDRSLIADQSGDDSRGESYRIPHLIPGRHEAVIRHPVLAAREETVMTRDGEADFCDVTDWKEGVPESIKEISVYVVRNLLSAAAAGQPSWADADLFEACMEEAAAFVEEEGQYLRQGEGTLLSVDASDFSCTVSQPSLEEGGDIRASAALTYSYQILRETETVNWEEYNEDGTPVTVTDTIEEKGTSQAEIGLVWSDGAWKAVSLDLPATAEVTG